MVLDDVGRVARPPHHARGDLGQAGSEVEQPGGSRAPAILQSRNLAPRFRRQAKPGGRSWRAPPIGRQGCRWARRRGWPRRWRAAQAVQPEATPARLEAGDHLDRGGEPGFGALALPGSEGEQPRRVATVEPFHDSLLGARPAQRGKPGRAAEIEASQMTSSPAVGAVIIGGSFRGPQPYPGGLPHGIRNQASVGLPCAASGGAAVTTSGGFPPGCLPRAGTSAFGCYGRELKPPEAQRRRLLAGRALVHRRAEHRLDPPLQADAAPPRHPVPLRIGARLHPRREFGLLHRRAGRAEAGRAPRAPRRRSDEPGHQGSADPCRKASPPSCGPRPQEPARAASAAPRARPSTSLPPRATAPASGASGRSPRPADPSCQARRRVGAPPSRERHLERPPVQEVTPKGQRAGRGGFRGPHGWEATARRVHAPPIRCERRRPDGSGFGDRGDGAPIQQPFRGAAFLRHAGDDSDPRMVIA